jgi:hypothetical protein
MYCLKKSLGEILGYYFREQNLLYLGGDIMIKNENLLKGALLAVEDLNKSIKTTKETQAKLFSIGEFEAFETSLKLEMEFRRLRAQHIRVLTAMSQLNEMTDQIAEKYGK